VTGNIAKVTEKPRRITSGTIGLPVEFTFDDQWDGLSKKAVFRTGHFSIVCELNEEGNTVPWEVLVFPNMWLSIGVYGVNEGGTVSIPTIWVNVSVIQPGTVPDGASPAEPTPPVWQRIEDEVNRIGGVVDDVNDKYDDTQEQVVANKKYISTLLGRIVDLEKEKSMRVVFNMGDMVANYNAIEIANRVENGGYVSMDVEAMLVPLSFFDYGENRAYFDVFYDYGVMRYWVDADGSADAMTINLATAADIGDISSALDEIREYAESLINGGGSV
jgi:hypothetical protein